MRKNIYIYIYFGEYCKLIFIIKILYMMKYKVYGSFRSIIWLHHARTI